MRNRPKVILYITETCPVCKGFYERFLRPLYDNNMIDLITVEVSIDKEIKELGDSSLLVKYPFTGYSLHYDMMCRRHGRCVVPAVEIIPPYKKIGEYKSDFIFTEGDEDEFEKMVTDHLKKYINVTARLRW